MRAIVIFIGFVVTTGRLGNVPVRTLLIDNYDSYTYNVWQLLADINAVEPYVIHNDDFTNWETAVASLPTFDNIVISPGPGNPINKEDFGICADAIRLANVPILGICLGHQGIAHIFGGSVGLAPTPIHGRLSRIVHTGRGIFAGVEQGTEVVRYHSLVAELPLPPHLRVTATSDDGLVMGIEHVDKPIHGVQFHPESIATTSGRIILQNFKQMTLDYMNSVNLNTADNLPREDNAALVPPGRSSRVTEGPSTTRDLPRRRRFIHIARKHVKMRNEKKDLEWLFKSLYGSSPASFWLDSALPLADYKKCVAVAAGDAEEDKEEDGKKVENHDEDCRFDDGSEQPLQVFSYMGALDSVNAFAAEYHGANELQIRRIGNNATSIRQNIFGFIDQQLCIHRDEREVCISLGCGFDVAAVAGAIVPFDAAGAMFGYISYEARAEATRLLNAATTSSSGHQTDSSCNADYTSSNGRGNTSENQDVINLVGDLSGEMEREISRRTTGSTGPTAVMICPTSHIVFDHKESMIYCVSMSDDNEKEKDWVSRSFEEEGVAAVVTERRARERAEQLLERAVAIITAAPTTAATSSASGQLAQQENKGSLQSEKSYEEYYEDIEKSLNYIRNGESYEICLTAEFKGNLDSNDSAWDLYRRLRANNPAPYSSYIHYDPSRISSSMTGDMDAWCRPGGISVCCSSPERYLKIDKNGVIESKPIKGTAKRDFSSTSADETVRVSLQTDEKTRSENLMIVDLVRNDIGRVCEVGSVRVPTFMGIETYATVHQMVSTIRGQLRSNLNVADALVATFPGGSMTGSPKLRTMDIIAELEGRQRGVYSGTIGVIGFNGVCDLNIVIRTAVVNGRRLHVSAGGAIVALSDTRKEIDEVLLKAYAVSKAIGYSLSFANDVTSSTIIGDEDEDDEKS